MLSALSTVLAVASAALCSAEKKSDVPITEIVTLGQGTDHEAKMQGRDIEFNTCVPYEPKEYGTVSVCGAITDDGCDTTSPDMNHWLEAAQSYTIVQCGAGKGEVHDFKGPACKGMEECMQYAKEQEEQAKMDKMESEYKDGFSGKGLVGARYGRGQRNTISSSFD